jgi:RHS repeat-associated protein
MILMLMVSFVLSSSTTMAQSSSTTARTPGTPAGSYKLGDADTINLFTGNLNYNLPLLGVGGRGETQAGLGVVIEGQWDVKVSELPNGYYQHEYSFHQPNPLAFVGSVRLDNNSFQTDDPCDSNGNYSIEFKIGMTYVEPDGTEHSLRDTIKHSLPFRTCGAASQNIGKTFEDTSGSFVTFVNDTNVYSSCYGVSGCTNNVDGYLFFRNGIKSRVVGGKITWTQDRNGNRIEYTYETTILNRLIKIKDSINREIDVEYDVNDSEPYGLCTRIKYKGFGGDEKIIRIGVSDTLSTSLLRNTQSGDSSTPINPLIYDDTSDNVFITHGGNQPGYVKAVWLPDGRAYKFKYNVLSQLARVDLPTGGAIEYDFADLSLVPFEAPPNTGGVPGLTNRVSEKRVYDTNNTLVSKTVFSNPTSYTSGVIPSSRGGVVRDVEVFDPSGSRLSKSRHFFYGTPNAEYGLLVPWWHGREFRSETFGLDGATLLRVAENDWRQRNPSWCTSNWPCLSNPTELAPTNNPFVVETRSTLVDGNLVSKVSAVNPADGSWAFDAYNNQTDTWQSDYGSGQPGALVKHTHISYINNLNLSGGVYLLGLTDTASIYSVSSSGQDSLASSSQIVYDEYTQYPLLTYSSAIGWQDPGNVRGNPTTVKGWLNTNSSWIETHAQYDQLGNVRKSWDALGRLSETSYLDAFTTGGNRNTYAFPTLSTSPIPDATNTHGSDSAFVSSSVYDYSSGLVKTSTDINGQSTNFEYDDELDRLTKVIDPTGDGWTSFEYGDTVGNLYVKTTTTLDAARNLKSISYFDGLGRATESHSYETATSYVTTKQEYDALDRVTRSYNPFRTTTDATYGWTDMTYDALGRVHITTTSDGSQAITTFSGNQVTIQDQAGKQRRSITDSLGRLRQIFEAPNDVNSNYQTDYDYDVLGNLKTVTQGVQTRTFIYDSLSRLTSAFNPESGTVNYHYDGNSNLDWKSDARGVKTTNAYDSLNRVKTRTYSLTGSTPPNYVLSPDVSYFYDGTGMPADVTSIPAYSKGQLTAVKSAVSDTIYTEFDALGHVMKNRQVVDPGTSTEQKYLMEYSYDLMGNMISQKYPSGKIIETEYDDAGRVAGVKHQVDYYAGGTPSSSNRILYTAHGAVSDLRLGNGRWEHTLFNNRLQPNEIGLGTAQGGTDLMKLGYTYTTGTSTANNNGNVRSQTITVPGLTNPIVQSYTYDPLNRLQSMSETGGLSQTFDYDRYGNRIITGGFVQDPSHVPHHLNQTDPTLTDWYDPITNKLKTENYDDAGNIIKDTLSTNPGNSFDYDSENKQVKYNGGAASGGTDYKYDGDGRRIKKISGTGQVTTVFVYNAMGQMVAEYSNTPPASGNGGTSYLTSDSLGTPRVITDSSGAVTARHDYLPFGEEIQANDTDTSVPRKTTQGYVVDNIKQKFTQYERDDETGLDFAQARYYSSSQGRFTTVDPLMASANSSHPQSWNRYSYTFNNPLNFIDPTGERTSTHTDKDGRVLSVIDDGDLNIYRHNDVDASSGEERVVSVYPDQPLVETVGQTEHWDEFRAHADYSGAIQPEVAKGARIAFRQSFEYTIKSKVWEARLMSLEERAAELKPGREFDIKKDYESPNVGMLMPNGKYATARSAGNYLAGYLGATGTQGGFHISETYFMKLAGALHQHKFNALSAVGLALPFVRPSHSAPYYGEIEHAGRQISAGFRAGLRDMSMTPIW